MDNLDTIVDRIDAHRMSPDALSPLLLDYLRVSEHLMYTSPATIRHTQRVLGRAIIAHAIRKSPVYADKIDPKVIDDLDCMDKVVGSFSVGKDDLVDKRKWYTGTFPAMDNQTSGSTGARFQYRIWKDGYDVIERDCHYGMILKEFGIADPRVLYVESPMTMPYKRFRRGDLSIMVAEDQMIRGIPRLICSHGSDSWCAHIAFDHNSYIHSADYCKFVIEYIQEHNVNVLMSLGGFFELLTTYLIADEASTFPRLVKLMSNTGDKVNRETLDFLKDTGTTDSWCDHMRCWDGGAGFFTCKNGTYHLQDELAYIYTVDGKLCSTDFFSYPSPFVNYLNGDYCSINEEYSLCECGRWYRPFLFHNRSPRRYETGNGGTFTTDDVIRSLLGKYEPRFFAIQDGAISVEDSGLSDEDKKNMVADMAKLYVMVHFFTNPALKDYKIKSLSSQPCAPSDEECWCSYCTTLKLSCILSSSNGWQCFPGF